MHLSSDADLANAWLLQHLIRSIPELSQPYLADDIRVSAVRRWLSRNLCAADESTSLTNLGVDVYSLSPATVLWNSHKRAAGTFCDGTAEAARKVYELLGYRACLIDMGDPLTRATHAVTLVELCHNGEKRVTVQDCYFGCTWRYADLSPVDFSDLQQRLERGDIADVHLKSDQELKWLLYGPDKDAGGILRHYGFRCDQVIPIGNSHQAARAEWNLPGFIASEPHYGRFLEKQHHSSNFTWMFRWPIFVTPNQLGGEIASVFPSGLAVA